MHTFAATLFALAVSLGTLSAQAADDNAQCSTVKLADPGWSDIATTNAVARLLLEPLGYQVKVDSLAVPIIYGGLKDGQVDAFLGSWMPAHQGFHDKFVANGMCSSSRAICKEPNSPWRCRTTCGMAGYAISQT